MNEVNNLDKQSLFSDKSYAKKYFDYDQTYFLDNKYAIQIVFNETIDYSNPFDQFRIEQFISKVEESDLMAKQTQCWLRSFLSFVNIVKQTRNRPIQLANYDLTSKEGFYGLLKNVFLPMSSSFIYRSDIVFNQNLTEIISSRCIVWSGHLTNSTDEKEMLDSLYKMADSSKLVSSFLDRLFFVEKFSMKTNFLFILNYQI